MIVDTNAISAWRSSDIALLDALPPDSQLLLPVIAVGEFLFGINRFRQRALNQEWLNELCSRVPVAHVTLETAARYADVGSGLQGKGRPIRENDMWIAALALQHGLPVLSRDTHLDVVDGLTRVSW